MLDLLYFFEQIKELRYFVTKIDVPYVPEDFPKSYAVGKDIDIIVDQRDFRKIYDIVQKFSSDYNNFQHKLIKEKKQQTKKTEKKEDKTEDKKTENKEDKNNK